MRASRHAGACMSSGLGCSSHSRDSDQGKELQPRKKSKCHREDDAIFEERQGENKERMEDSVTAHRDNHTSAVRPCR